MSDLLHRTYKLPQGCNCKTITVRETNGIDEQNAAIAADAKKTGTYVELIRISIAEVDGAPVQQPFVALESWTSKTRKAVMKFFEKQQ